MKFNWSVVAGIAAVFSLLSSVVVIALYVVPEDGMSIERAILLAAWIVLWVGSTILWAVYGLQSRMRKRKEEERLSAAQVKHDYEMERDRRELGEERTKVAKETQRLMRERLDRDFWMDAVNQLWSDETCLVIEQATGDKEAEADQRLYRRFREIFADICFLAVEDGYAWAAFVKALQRYIQLSPHRRTAEAMVAAASRAEDLPDLLSDAEYLIREQRLPVVEAFARRL